jgi:hypothetical protein
MKLHRVLGLAAILCAPAVYGDTIADWTFETSQPTSAGPYSPEVGSGSATGHHANSTTYSTPAGDGSAHSYNSTNWSSGDYYQFQISTAGYSNITLSFEQTSSGSGPADFNLQYSTNGTTFNLVQSYSVGDTSWGTTGSPKSTIFSNISLPFAVTNQATVYIRMTDADTTSAGGASVGTAGTDRVDNVSLTGDKLAISAPLPAASEGLLLSGGFLAMGRRRRTPIN